MTQALYIISLINKDPMRAFTGVFIAWIILQVMLSFILYEGVEKFPPPPVTREETSDENESEPGCLHVEGIEICDVEV